ncbi:hypothetical protein GCM10009836_41570 [Pseudonocardia ailaonensis]|uniref:Uncharacterized protein n=1 Tax=Pseudonocardia ailaonensis TaxID=367279 RepID=A0ABN2N835_9PSEU
MTDRERTHGANGTVRRRTTVRVRGVEDTGPFPGRHASRTEIAAETPIFHDLTIGGWRSGQAARPQQPARRRPAEAPVDALDDFRRDPLTAPIPVQAYAALAAPVPAGHVPAPARVRVPAPSAPAPAPISAGPDRAPLYAAHVPAYAPAAPAYTSLTDTGPHALAGLSSRSGRHHRRAVSSGSGLHHLGH